MFVQTIVCFANSRKDGRRCVAGKTWSRTGCGDWVRPVSRDPSRALPPALVAYQNGAQPCVLDIMQVPLDSALPEGHQQENALTNQDYFWTKTGQVCWADIDQWIDTPQQLWSLHDQSNGMINNRVSTSLPVHSSLRLVRVSMLHIKLIDAPLAGNPYRRVVVGEFVYHGVSYRLHVTDTDIEAQCRAHPQQSLQLANAVLCVSLGNGFRQHYYKLIASVLHERRFA
jgi:hypothetical protein